jgi:hypothetical protein
MGQKLSSFESRLAASSNGFMLYHCYPLQGQKQVTMDLCSTIVLHAPRPVEGNNGLT